MTMQKKRTLQFTRSNANFKWTYRSMLGIFTVINNKRKSTKAQCKMYYECEKYDWNKINNNNVDRSIGAVSMNSHCTWNAIVFICVICYLLAFFVAFTVCSVEIVFLQTLLRAQNKHLRSCYMIDAELCQELSCVGCSIFSILDHVIRKTKYECLLWIKCCETEKSNSLSEDKVENNAIEKNNLLNFTFMKICKKLEIKLRWSISWSNEPWCCIKTILLKRNEKCAEH